ncbi:DUF5667 domain-containing protein, partial [Frankia gtarii]|uniref:DUF5667 domain-containing protein n=1 Tax=Frankia gtarii TaxID=2950102 RepID=UPI0021BDF3FD
PTQSAMARGSGATGRRVRRVSPRQARVLRTARPLMVVSLACAVALVGLAVSAEDALPGETLYSVKRQVENIQVSLVRDPIAKAKTRLDVAGTRMDELRTITLGQGARIDRPTGAANQPPSGPASLLPPTDPFAQLWITGTGLPLPPVRPVAPVEPIQTPPPSRPAAPVLPSPPAASPPTAAPTAPAASATTATTATAGSAIPAGSATTTTTTTSTTSATSATSTTSAALAASGRYAEAGTVNSLLRAWCAQARAGSRVLLARATTGNADAWATMDAFTTEQSDRLTPVLAALPAGTSEAARATLGLIDEFRHALGLRFPRATAPAAAQPAGATLTTAPSRVPQEPPPSAAPTSQDDAEPTTTPTPAGGVIGTPDEKASRGRTEVSRAAEPAKPSAPTAQGQPNAPSAAALARQAGGSSPVPAVRAPNPPNASPPSSPTSAPVDRAGQAGTTSQAVQAGTIDKAGTAGEAGTAGGAGATATGLGADPAARLDAAASTGTASTGTTSTGTGGWSAGDSAGSAPAAGTQAPGAATG